MNNLEAKSSVIYFDHLSFMERLEFCFEILISKVGILKYSQKNKTSTMNTITTTTEEQAKTFVISYPANLNITKTGTQLLSPESTKKIEPLEDKKMINEEEFKRLKLLEDKWNAILEEDDENCDANDLSIQDLEALANDENSTPLVKTLASAAAFHRMRASALSKLILN
jgi:hypothetical protein